MNNKALNIVKRVLLAIALPAIVYLILGIIRPDIYFSFNTLIMQLTQTMKLTLVGWAMLFGMSVGLFDFSVGSRIILAGLVGIHMSQFMGVIGFVLGVVVTSLILAGITGAAFAGLRIPSIITGYAMLLIFESIATIYQKKFTVIVTDNIAIFGKAPGIYVLTIVAFVLIYVVFNNTKFGYQIKAIGGNEAVARSMGIKAVQLKLLTYIVGGAFLSIAALVEVGYTGSVTAKTSMQSMQSCFTPMMGVMIGMNLASCNPVVGSFIGSFCISIVGSGLVALGIESRLQNVVVGLFLLVFLGLKGNSDRLSHLFSRKKKEAVNIN